MAGATLAANSNTKRINGIDPLGGARESLQFTQFTGFGNDSETVKELYPSTSG